MVSRACTHAALLYLYPHLWNSRTYGTHLPPLPPPRLPPEWVCWTHLSVANKNYIIEVNIFRVFLFRRLFVFVSRIRHNNSDPSGSQSLFTFTSVSDPYWICFFRPSRSGSVFGIRIQFLSTTWIRIRFPNTVPDDKDHHWIQYGTVPYPKQCLQSTIFFLLFSSCNKNVI